MRDAPKQPLQLTAAAYQFVRVHVSPAAAQATESFGQYAKAVCSVSIRGLPFN
jgi:hypothetical protein